MEVLMFIVLVGLSRGAELKYYFAAFVLCLSGCVTSPKYSHFECFESRDQAQQVGSDIFLAGFTERVGHRLGLSSNRSVKGLGLRWGGIKATDYCESGHPLIVTYDSIKSDYDPEQVMFWSKIIFREMISEVKKAEQ
ncbi:hypothetical protein SAMN04488070_1870 [Pseudidiomarina maritima]|jgi:hypothetical protein|uniref:Uncharacterized protein n=1 Tax=Pseudidiomarina maritima TaxID=519453 RepID=A0A1I6HJZ5_9GAMM|nr:hypothetical protein [Pseudidiomarina maritima]SFR54738.1 hypothetical protein SAMN04488070_1870 [Pseudidiomarina maritima]